MEQNVTSTNAERSLKPNRLDVFRRAAEVKSRVPLHAQISREELLDTDIVPETPEPLTPFLNQKQILDATESLLIEVGYDGTTIRQIAKRLNCAVGSIYRYFSDKRSLLSAVTERRFEPVAGRVEFGSPMERTMSLYVKAAQEQPELYRLMFWINSVGRRERSATVPSVVQRIIDGWSGQLRNATQAWQIWAQLHGCVMLGFDDETTQETLGMLSLETMPLVAEISTTRLSDSVFDENPADEDAGEPIEPITSPYERLTK